MKKLVLIILASFAALISVKAQVQTITISSNNAVFTHDNNTVSEGVEYYGETVNVPTNCVACLKSIIAADTYTYLSINVRGTITSYASPSSSTILPLSVAGPATIQIRRFNTVGANDPRYGNYVFGGSFATFSIEPGPFPPGKTVTVGAYSGNVQVTMEMSTDLVNWTQAVNAQVYTNSPDARFFRIKLVTNATP